MTDNAQKLFGSNVENVENVEIDNKLNSLQGLSSCMGPVYLDSETVNNALTKSEDHQLIVMYYQLSKQKSLPSQQPAAFTSSPFVEPYDNDQEVVQSYKHNDSNKKHNPF